MKFRRFAKRATVVSLFIGVLLASAVAFAWWSASGTGNGYAKATTAQALTTVNVGASTTAQLYPGGNADLLIRITNPNGYDVTVTQINGNGAITSGNSTCDTAAGPYTGNGVTYTNQSGTWLVAAGTSQTFTLSNVVHMANSATTSNDSCQGQVFTVPVSLVRSGS